MDDPVQRVGDCASGALEPVGVVLAGGLGRRLGGDKAMVALGGLPLISYPLAAMQTALRDVAVIAKKDTLLPHLPDVTIWIEGSETHHPLVGVVEALALAEGRPVLVCAGDLPFVTPSLIRALAGLEPADAPAVIAAFRGDLQPLLGCYQPSAAALLAGAFDRSVREIVRSIGPGMYEVGDPELLFNVNAPEDLLRAAAMLDARASGSSASQT